MLNRNQFGEPWLALPMELHEGGTGVEIVDFKGQVVANNQTYYPAAVTSERATRIALCVSACARIPNENLDGVSLHEKLLEASEALREAAVKGAEVATQRDALLDALKSLSSLDIKGHAIIDRLQFSDEGRALAAKIRAAIQGMGGAQ